MEPLPNVTTTIQERLHVGAHAIHNTQSKTSYLTTVNGCVSRNDSPVTRRK